MFAEGQYVNTKYGVGTVVQVGAVKPHLYVRIDSNSQIYLLSDSDVVAVDHGLATSGGIDSAFQSGDGTTIGDEIAASRQPGTARPGRHQIEALWREPMTRGQRKPRRPVNETPLSVFVHARLEDLDMKQSDFCRVTGFDQGLLSKIQSSM